MSNKKIVYSLLFILGIGVAITLYFSSLEKRNFFSFPEMIYPEDNQQSKEKIEFGRQLFFDKRLSLSEEISCSSCHLPHLAFTDGEKKSVGIRGNHSMRNAPTLLNIGYASVFMADAHISSLEMQAIVPIQDTNEMGIRMGDLIRKLQLIDKYQTQSQHIFGRDFDAFVLTRSLASFQRSLISLNSPFDQFYYQKNISAISEDAKKGWVLFSEKLNCVQCHPPPFFTTFKAESNGLTANFNNDFGRFRVTKDSTDYGKFKIPTLRNVAITAPYLHDGSIDDLDKLIQLYSQGGFHFSNQSELISPFEITKEERKELISFLKSLTSIEVIE